jgi:ATP-binding cassette, subfamily F, member 3
MLTVNKISKSFGIDTILKDVTFSLNPGDRMGLIGPNGSGKTTLLRILTGEESPDSGHIQWHPGYVRVGYLTQGLEASSQETVGSYLSDVGGNLSLVTSEVELLAEKLAALPEAEDIQQEYDEALARLVSASETAKHTPEILGALNLDNFTSDTPIAVLSGGQKTRLALAAVLLGDPQILLLDEPTNHLDLEMLEWLEEWLNVFQGAALIVSHDRTFLDRTVNRILELDPETHTVREYVGSYTDYLEQYLAERDRQIEAYKDQVYEIRRMKQDIARTKQQALQVELTTTSRQPGPRRYAKKVAKKALSREKKLDRYLDSDERVEKPKDSWQMKLEFGETAHSGRDVLVLEDLAVGYDDHRLLSDINLFLPGGSRGVLVGPNGSGKTTLLKTIAGKIEPLAGQVKLGSSVRLGYMSQEQEELDPGLDPYSLIRSLASFSETDTRAFLHLYLFTGDEVFLPVGKLSYGERSRLSLACLVARGCNFLLLDEPINHLDIPSRSRFEQALSAFQGTVLAVVHDRYFIQGFAKQVWIAENKKLRASGITEWQENHVS